MMNTKSSVDRTAGHRTAEKHFKEMVYEHASLFALLSKYGHQSNFWQRLELEMSRKDLEIDHCLLMLKHCPFKSHMERSKRTGKLIRIYD